MRDFTNLETNINGTNNKYTSQNILKLAFLEEKRI